MADKLLSYRHKETRINFESAIPGSTVAIRLPTHGTPSWSARAAQKRPLHADVPPAEDESTFKQRYLASAASIYHREHHQSPRSFLWRVLEDGRVLSIQVVDLCKQDKAVDAYLTLRLNFPSPIRQSCIALSDSREHDVLSVFALTESNHLYILTLRPEFFRKRASTEDNVGDWCKIYLSSAFSFKHPHRLVALGSENLLVSLHDGGLLKLDRVPGGDSSAWKETFYNEGGWTQGLRSLIPFQGNNTIRYGKVNIELSAVTSIASPATNIDGVPFAVTVSLDHKLRIWNLANGKLAYLGDLLGQERLPNEIGKYMIYPSQSQLVKVYQDNEGKTLVVTFSPVGAGQFKFWTMIPDMEGNIDMEDLFPEEILEPPAPTSDVWTLADFSLVIDKDDWGSLTIWVLWKNNTTYRVKKADFRLDSPAQTRNLWASGWTGVKGEEIVNEPTPMILSSDSADCTEKWLEYILFPGRFTVATIETALTIYERGLGGAKTSTVRGTKNLAKKMCTLVASNACLERNAEGQMEFGKYRDAINTQWLRFYRLIIELDKQRGEALSLVFDGGHDIAMVITADGLSPIRDCTEMEQVWHNDDQVLPGRAKSVSQLLEAASNFRGSFRDSLYHACNTLLSTEVFNDTSVVNLQHLRDLHNQCDIDGQISDEDENQLLQDLGGNWQLLTTEVYESLLQTMIAAEELDQRLERSPLAATGRRAVIRGVQETIYLHRWICLDQLVLLLFIENEEFDKEAREVDLDTVAIYKKLIRMLKRLEMLSWLSRTQISVPVSRLERSSPSKKPDETKTMTVLEGCVGHLLGLVTHSGESAASLLSGILTRLCDPDGEYELQPALIQCFLLKMERPDLALDFSRFAGQDPFSTYVQGRVSLAVKDLPTAAMYFTKAAFGLGMNSSRVSSDCLAHKYLAHPDPKIGSDRHSSGLLDDTEWNLLYAGLPRYYYHIVSLFDKDKSYSFVIDFARVALQSISAGAKDDYIMDLRTELHSRFFNAALQTSRWDMAYSALMLFTDHALQLSSLRSLVFRMCESSSATELLDLPFIGLQSEVDDILSQKCQAIVDVNVGVPYHKILYAWRIHRNDFRGAAAVSLERLQRLQQSGDGDKVSNHGPGADELETPVTRQYLQLINALSCVDPKQAWILSEPLPSKTTTGGSHASGKRKVVTLEDARKGYQEELDRIAAIENNQFAFAGGDEMDIL